MGSLNLKNSTLTSTGRMLIDVRTGVVQSDRNAGQPRLRPLTMLELFEQLTSHGSGQMTLTSPEMSTCLVTPTSNHFCQGLHMRSFYIIFLLP